ncbi:MAG TPA: hypothetical protein VIM69_10685 [Opitutaceae bacterium]
MLEYTVYDPLTGIILRYGECPEEDWDKQAGSGEAMWRTPEKLKDTEWMIVNGEKARIGHENK